MNFGGLVGANVGIVENSFAYNESNTPAVGRNIGSGTTNNVFYKAASPDISNGGYLAGAFASVVLNKLNGHENTKQYPLYAWKSGASYPVFDTTQYLPGTVSEYKSQYKKDDEVTIGDFVYKVLTADTAEDKPAKFELIRYNGKGESVVIENGVDSGNYIVTSIASRNQTLPFRGKTNVKSVTMPDTVTVIGMQAFSGCTNLTDLTLSKNITSIEKWAFSGCSGLTEVSLPSSLETLGYGAFMNCTSIEKVTIPKTVTSFSDGCQFIGCTSLKDVTLEAGLSVLGQQMFSGCTALQSIVIPSSVKDWGGHEFQSCTNLSTVTIQEGVQKIGNGAFAGCKALKNIALPSSVTTLEDNCFSAAGLESITLGENIKSIGSKALSCKGISSVALPDGLKTIGKSAFGSAALTSLSIPATVDSITGQPCQSETITSYEVAADNAKYKAIDGVIYEMQGNEPIKAIAYPNGKTGEGYEIPESVTTIGEEAFYNTYNLKTLTINDKVTLIESKSVGYNVLSAGRQQPCILR